MSLVVILATIVAWSTCPDRNDGRVAPWLAWAAVIIAMIAGITIVTVRP